MSCGLPFLDGDSLLTGKFPAFSGMMKSQQDNTNNVGSLSCSAHRRCHHKPKLTKVHQGQHFSRGRDNTMVSSKNSPIVHISAAQRNKLYPHYRSASLFEHADLLVILTFCFLLYGFFIYYLFPSVAPNSYHRVMAELSYQWQGAWRYFQHTWLQDSFFSLSLLDEWYHFLVTLVTA
jgi:hypothetical protein